LVKQQTMLANAMRGLAAEFGVTVSKGIRKLDELMTLVDEDENIEGLRDQLHNALLKLEIQEGMLPDANRATLISKAN